MEDKIKQEEKQLRQLRFMVDLVAAVIRQGMVNKEEARKIVKGLKRYVTSSFPGSDQTFEIIYGSRFKRIIKETFGDD
jgi:cyanate lyase